MNDAHRAGANRLHNKTDKHLTFLESASLIRKQTGRVVLPGGDAKDGFGCRAVLFTEQSASASLT